MHHLHVLTLNRCRWKWVDADDDDVMQERDQLRSQYHLLQTHCEDLEKTCAELGSQLSQYVHVIDLFA